MLLETVGQVLNIHREVVPGRKKEGQEQKMWEKVQYQILTSYHGRPVELVNLEEFGEQGKIEVNQQLENARRNGVRVQILVNITLDKRGEVPSIASRIVQVDPVRGMLFGTSSEPTSPQPPPKGNGKDDKQPPAGAQA